MQNKWTMQQHTPRQCSTATVYDKETGGSHQLSSTTCSTLITTALCKTIASSALQQRPIVDSNLTDCSRGCIARPPAASEAASRTLSGSETDQSAAPPSEHEARRRQRPWA